MTLQFVVKGKRSWIQGGMWITVQAKWQDSICPIWVTPKRRQYFSCLSFTNKAWIFPRTQVAETLCPCSGCLRTGNSWCPNAPNHSLGAQVQPRSQDGRCHLLKYRVQFSLVFICPGRTNNRSHGIQARMWCATGNSSSAGRCICLIQGERNWLLLVLLCYFLSLEACCRVLLCVVSSMPRRGGRSFGRACSSLSLIYGRPRENNAFMDKNPLMPGEHLGNFESFIREWWGVLPEAPRVDSQLPCQFCFLSFPLLCCFFLCVI